MKSCQVRNRLVMAGALAAALAILACASAFANGTREEGNKVSLSEYHQVADYSPNGVPHSEAQMDAPDGTFSVILGDNNKKAPKPPHGLLGAVQVFTYDGSAHNEVTDFGNARVTFKLRFYAKSGFDGHLLVLDKANSAWIPWDQAKKDFGKSTYTSDTGNGYAELVVDIWPAGDPCFGW
jgi:hypothetical protein